LWNLATSSATPIVACGDYAAVRAVLSVFGELPGDINSAAPT
jgi:hypothetical protein